jgi:hypothetical protein
LPLEFGPDRRRPGLRLHHVSSGCRTPKFSKSKTPAAELKEPYPSRFEDLWLDN